jgi:glycosyltransferase involved in cell wall biosynthesis
MIVHCSLKPEAFGRVLIEAMACQSPVVAARDGGVEEIVKDGEHGYLVAPGDLPAYVKAISALLAAPERAMAIGRAGRDNVEMRFSLGRMVNQFENLIEKILGSN